MKKPGCNLLIRLLLMLFLLSAVDFLFSQDSTERTPAWILYERGKAELERKNRKEPGKALQLFRQAIDRAGIFPEAEVALGDVYFFEREFILAEEQYKKAYKLRNSFDIPEEKYVVLQKLAGLYELNSQYKQMEDVLLKILADHPVYNDKSYQSFRGSFVGSFFYRGLNNHLRLYRLEKAGFALKAHAKLGWLFYRTGRFNQSIIQSLYALNIMVSESIAELRPYYPEYEYTTMDAFIAAAFKRQNIADYLFESDFFGVLYYLASANYADGRPGPAFALWEILAAVPAGRYADLSRRQLKSPWIEPYIIESPRIPD